MTEITLSPEQLDELARIIDDRKLLSINQACQELGISTQTFYRLRRDKHIKPDTTIFNSPRYFKGTIMKCLNGE